MTVNAISPNAATRMISSIPERSDCRRSPRWCRLGRLADPEEIAAGVLFLASLEDAAYITGTILQPIDGGVSM